MTNTTRISGTGKILITGAAVVAVLGAGAAAASGAVRDPSLSDGPSTTTQGTTATGTGSAAEITYGEAVRIAKKRVPGARVTEVEREWEDGQRVWQVELEKRYMEYDVYISVKTGKIIKFRQERDDD